MINMLYRDGTGPEGKGPRTGRGVGPCGDGKPKGGGRGNCYGSGMGLRRKSQANINDNIVNTSNK